MADIGFLQKDTLTNYRSYKCTSAATADEVTFDSGNFRNATILVSGISADSLQVSGAVTKDGAFVAIGSAITAAGVTELKAISYSKLKITRTGALDGSINIEVGLSCDC